jgi:hypothetical protein
VITGSALKQPATIEQAVGAPEYRVRANASGLRRILSRWHAGVTR